MIWVDLLLAATLVFSCIQGYRKGFILTLFSLGSYVAAAIFSRIYYIQLSEWIQKQPFFSSRIRYFVSNTFDLNIATGNGAVEEITFKLPAFLQHHISNQINLEVYAQETMGMIRNHIEGVLVTFFINLISIVVLFIVIRAIILAIGYLVNGVFKLPVLNAFNSAIGSILGLIRGMVILIIMTLIMVSISLASPEGVVSKGLQQSILIPFFYENVLSYILAWL